MANPVLSPARAGIESSADDSRGARRLLRLFDRALIGLVEGACALLLAAEIIVLLAGVTSRYVLHAPLVWSDELAGMMFLWLSMLGAVLALRHGEHMRMTALVASAGPRLWAYLDVVATCAALAFLILIVHPAYEYAYEESFITTPALQISNTWRAAALPVGTCLMAAFALLRLARVGDLRTLLLAVITVVALVGLWAAHREDADESK